MNKSKIAGVTVAALFSIAVILSGSIHFNDNITPSITSSSIEENIEVGQVRFKDNFQIGLENRIERATLELKGNNENNLSILEIPMNDIQEDTQVYKQRDRESKLNASRGRSYSPRELSHLKSPEAVAREVLNGEYGNGEERKLRLEQEGYNYSDIQSEVAKLLPKIKSRLTPVIEVNRGSVTREKSVNLDVDVVVAKEKAISVQGLKGSVIKAYPHKAFKSYMSWTVLNKKSPQYKLCATAAKDPTTAIMMVNGRYLVALGFAYTNHIGEKIDVVMESGQVIPVIVGDWKAKEHTDKWNSASTNNGSIIEFIVSSNSEAARATNRSGSYNGIFPGYVKEFRK